MGEIRIGTSGWSYPSGAGTWNGLFYPQPGERRRGFDELAYYAEHFDTVEVNVTFYRPPVPGMSASWVRRTPQGFDLSLKLHQRFTHAGLVGRGSPGPTGARDRDAAGGTGASSNPPGERHRPAVSIPAFTPADLDEFRTGIEPLAASGKLGALLAQFPPSFRDEAASRDYLVRLLRAFSDYPLAVELRHRSWSDAQGETLALLREFGAAFVQIDEPKFRSSIRQNLVPNTAGSYYLRLHGRNAAAWWRHENPDDRYNYLYSSEELRPFAENARAVRALVKKAYLYFNNHFAAKAVVNATVLKHALAQPVTGEYRAPLLERYPELGAIARPSPRALSLLDDE